MSSKSNTLPQMQYVRFGNTGMKVSRFCLGCMSYGSSRWLAWVKDEEESLELIGKAYEAGINFFDTANIYSNGESERVLGKAIKKFNMPRSRIVIATKLFFPVIDDKTHGGELEGINDKGLSRKHIFDAVDASLKRLGVDYIDLYQIHRFDPETPLEETMEALNDLVRSGKVRYIGASSGYAWQFQKANAIAERRGWAKFVSMQNLYNLLYREEEREMIPYCQDSGIAIIPWSPLARGLLTGKNRESIRLQIDGYIPALFQDRQAQNNDEIIDRVIELAKKHNRSPAQIALAWMLSKPYITSPIVGVGKESHLHDLLYALEVKLSNEDIKYLEEIYIPHEVARV
ncbi:Putative Aryl-alcohol dehydrogenase (NADP) [Rhizopus microsporus]|nr:Putative Aryl-alcohol dehydrogenase (NADP) [Rhizopus microsporus]